MAHVARNLQDIRERMATACARAGRGPDEVRLVAVSKRIDLDLVAQAVDAGQHDLGENRLSDALNRQAELAAVTTGAAAVRWHFIGHLQRNKAAKAAGRFHLIHGVHSADLAARLHRKAEELNLVQPVLLQVNIAAEPQKDGLVPADVPAVAEQVAQLTNLDIRGLMCMARFGDDEAALRHTFAGLRRLRDDLARRLQRPLPELSMGMSGDFEAAILEGATLVRVGTAVFGTRD